MEHPSQTKQKQVRLVDVSIPYYQTLLLSGGAGCVAWCVTHPFEMWKNVAMTAAPGTSQLDMLRGVQQRGFYRGFSTGVLRQMVYATSRLGFYPKIREGVVGAQYRLGWKSTTDVTKATLFDRALSGFLAGIIATLFSSPVDVCLVLQTTNAQRQPLLQVARTVFQTSGVTGFWRGYPPLALRSAVSGASQVGVHDHLLTRFRAYNGGLVDPNNSEKMKDAKVSPFLLSTLIKLKGTTPFHDNTLINVASGLTAILTATMTMPLEFARVQISIETRKPKGTPRRFTGVVQCLRTIVREEGIRRIYVSFLPFLCKYCVFISTVVFCLGV
ncbi:solute carrier family 25 (mitochondrial oxoglutarate transporter), member 11 [Angomonas deanei]|uniref:Mitochondrial carrier protein, putative n=1 Tax=Angomonas deanei TaxID=59799 RepID=A0A7G2CHH0_9TRYP|nr:solute carrier family 25 (mitochondrial oxoglutarate transporter), member 11 [Angomonas deanei]CAD2218869.1 Mitochondrial carrier protein, putative [Angomonas deanei]|eukprot:EPY30516.1 solute carrier family 25 (mitochondrial oxoglutarate transporter), member 11 [Angomonas deanei]